MFYDEDEDEDGLGGYHGETSGNWGVTTDRINPVSKDRYVRVFIREADALNYARTKARLTGPKNIDGKLNPFHKSYFVVYMPPGRYMRDEHGREQRQMSKRYRVAYGIMVPKKRGAGERAPRHSTSVSIPAKVPAILVFVNEGITKNGSIHWVMNKGLSTVLIQDDQE